MDHIFYPFTEIRLFAHLPCCEECCGEHGGAERFLPDPDFCSFGYLFYPRSLGSKPARHLPKETQLVSGSTWGELSRRCHSAVRAERSSSPCGRQPRARGSRAASRARWRGTRGCPGSEAPPSPAALLPTQVPLVKRNKMPGSWPRCLVTVPSCQPASRLSRALPGASSGDHGLWSLWAEVLLASHIMPSDDSSHGHRGNWLDP